MHSQSQDPLRELVWYPSGSPTSRSNTLNSWERLTYLPHDASQDHRGSHDSDTHIAHRVNEERSQSPAHLLFDERNPDAPVYAGVTILSAVRVGPAADAPPLLGTLADRLIGTIQSMITDKQAAIASRANELLAEL
jgi:hypothetical protein